jgi:membrane-associated phospholipid phosphatase
MHTPTAPDETAPAANPTPSILVSLRRETTRTGNPRFEHKSLPSRRRLSFTALAGLLLFFYAAAVDAQSPAMLNLKDGEQANRMLPGDIRLDQEYFKGYLYDTRHIAASALDWRPADWLRLSLLVGATLRLADEDDDIKTWLQSRRSPRTDAVASLGRPFGDGRYALSALGALYCYGRLSGNHKLQRTALLGFESAVISGAVTGVVKYLSHKRRPSSAETDEVPWGGPAASGAHLSFPSGHSACAFAVGTVIAMEYEERPLVPLLAYSAAALCAFSRLNDNAHWMSDVIVGSAIGHLTARAIVNRHCAGRESRLDLEPLLSGRGMGLSLCYRF